MLIRAKLEQYAANPASLANNVTDLKGERLVVLPESEYQSLVEAAEDAVDREALLRRRRVMETGERKTAFPR